MSYFCFLAGVDKALVPWVLLGFRARGMDALQVLAPPCFGPNVGLDAAELTWAHVCCCCPAAVHKQNSSFPTAADLTPLFSIKIHLKRNLRGKKQSNWCYLLDIL